MRRWELPLDPTRGPCPWVDTTCQISNPMSTGMSQSHPWRADLHLPSHPGDGCCLGHFTPHPRELNPLVLLSVGPAQPVPPKPRPHPTCRFCSISSYSLSSSRARSCSRMLASRCLLLHTLYSASLTSLLARHKVLSVSSAKRCRDETSGLPSLDRDDSHSGPGHHASQTQCSHGQSQRSSGI